MKRCGGRFPMVFSVRNVRCEIVRGLIIGSFHWQLLLYSHWQFSLAGFIGIDVYHFHWQLLLYRTCFQVMHNDPLNLATSLLILC